MHPVIAVSRAGALPHGAREAAVEVEDSPAVVAVAAVAAEVEVVAAVAND